MTTALRVLDHLGTVDEAGVSELSRDLGITTGTAHRSVTTLQAQGFVEQNSSTRKYRLTVKIVALADSVRSRLSIADLAHERIAALAERSGETSNLAMLKDGEVVYVDKVASEAMIGIEVRVGSRVPAYCTALGKAILAFTPESEVTRYLDAATFERYTPTTARSGTALRRKLELIRKCGYALDEGELLSDIFCCAAPILDAHGKAVAAVSISAPRSRFVSNRRQFISLVRVAARHLSSALPPTLWD